MAEAAPGSAEPARRRQGEGGHHHGPRGGRPLGRFLGRFIAVALVGVLAAGLAAGLTTATARPAAASAFLVAATPSHGSVLPTAPQEVSLTFSEPVEVVGDGVAVVGPDGGRVDPGTVRRPRPEVVSVSLPGVVAVTRQGAYTVAWHVVSADSRPVRGAFTFSIGTRQAAARSAAAASGAAPLVAGGYWLAGFAALAGLTMLAGGVVALGRAGPAASPVARRLLMAGWAVLVAATLAQLALRGPYAAGAGLARVVDRDLFGQTLHSHYGRALSVRLVLLGGVPALLGWGTDRAAGRRLRGRLEFAAAGTVAAGCLALTWTAVGAAAPEGPPALALATVQLSAAAAWLGALVAVLAASRTASRTALDDPVALPRRFGVITVVCPALIVITAGYLERPALGGAAELLTTTYGRLFAIKIVLLGGLLALAVRLHRRLRETGGPGSASIRGAAVGAALGALVLALTVAPAEVRPAAQALASRPTTLSARLDAGGGVDGHGNGVLEVRLPRTLRGVDEADLTVRAGAGGPPRDLPGLRAAWTQPAVGVGPLPVRLTRIGGGRYRLGWPPLPVAGGWRLAIASGDTGRVAHAVVSVRIR